MELEPLDELPATLVLYQCLQGLDYLHRSKYMHRDIKAGNIMLTDKGVCKIADFGTAALLNEPYGTARTFIGSLYWMAPEVILTETKPIEYDCKSDVYGVGITAIELVEGEPPNFDILLTQIAIHRLKYESPNLKDSKKWSQNYINFVKQTLTKHPLMRPTCKDCLEMDLFKNVDVNSREPLIELHNIWQNRESAEITELEAEDVKTDISDMDTNVPPPSELTIDSSSKNNRKIQTKTIRYQMNGVTKEKILTTTKSSDTKKDSKIEELREKILKQKREIRAEEIRELKRMETQHKNQLEELFTRQKSELRVNNKIIQAYMEKYKSENDSQQKCIIKEIDKKQTALKAEIDAYIKQCKKTLEKDRKKVNSMMKKKTENNLKNRVQSCVLSVGQFVEKQNKIVSEQYECLINKKYNRLFGMLAIFIRITDQYH
ncbi:Serine/threonine-protein kinase dst1 [Thelohanellus kitauei]|uniref:Serine/threonine-protein kinase dst1 n=1 Tax=Thelohanellus kitauei TaxID=669202 RepID=A0A0C2JB08_THEKT|nr:Serine/threonine-protein kinase dst1 [Thelohanellus kitauei]